MSEYIEREALRDALYEADAITMKGVAIINQFPAADVAPVVHGRWREDTDPADGDLRCTHCGIAWPKCVQKQIEEQGIWTLQTLFKCCPSCGSKMDKEAENERND
jgi:hypothetical protein